MAVYYKFKSAKDYDSVAIDGHFISVGHLKEKIFELKHLGRGTDFDLVVTNAQTNEEYPEEGMLIPKNTSVLVRRVPGRPRRHIISASVVEQEEPRVEIVSDDVQAVNGSLAGGDSSTMKYAEESEWDEFGSDLYAIPETVHVQASIPLQDAAPVSKEDEESKVRAVAETSALDWQRQPEGFGPGRGFGRGMGGRMISGRGFGSGRGGFEKKTPPQGYICHRCKVPGHFIQHCPTNGDPNFDIRRVRPPTGIPKSMLVAASDGSYALPSGAVAVLKPNEAAFEREIEGMPSTRAIGDLPPELHCPICKEVMKDAVLTSKCCFTSFCDKCIRDHIISKSMCICGATNVLADDLLPNKTLRDTINRILESNNNSAENGGSAFQIQDMESRNPQAKVPSPTQSVASRGLEVCEPPSLREETLKVPGTFEEDKYASEPQQPDKVQTSRVPDVSEATHDSKNFKDAVSQGSAPLADEEVQQKPVSGEIGKKKKKKKIRGPPGAAEMQWRAPNPQDLVPDNYMMTFGPSGFNPYWNGIQPGLDGFMPPYGGHMPYMGYGIGPMDMAFGGMLPHDPFGGPSYMLPYGPPPPRDLAELAMGYNGGPPVMSREEFETRKADLKRKREIDRRSESELPRDRDHGREGSSTFDVSSRSKSTQKPNYHSSNPDQHYAPRGRSPDGRSRGSEPPFPSSKKREEHRSPPEGRPRGPEPPIPSSKKREHRSPPEGRGPEAPILSSKKREQRSPVGGASRGPEPSISASKKRDRSPRDGPSRGPEHPILPSKKSSDHDHHRHRSSKGRSESPSADKKLKGSVFSRISFPENDSSSTKKKKLSSSTDAPTSGVAANGSNDDRKRSNADHDSSDDERHFKRRPSRYASSPPPTQSRGSRERDRGTYSKHR